jgi:hypothetical protein
VTSTQSPSTAPSVERAASTQPSGHVDPHAALSVGTVGRGGASAQFVRRLVDLATGRWAAVLVLLISSAGLSMFFWPGHMDADALDQIRQARSGQFSDWYAPILDWLWRGLFRLGGSPGIVLFCGIALTLLATHQLLRTWLSRWVAVVVTLLIGVFPPVLGFLGSLQRDTWFGAFTLAAYACIIRASRLSGRGRWGWAVLSLTASWFSIASRQNGVVAVLPAVVLASGLLIRPKPTGTRSPAHRSSRSKVRGAPTRRRQFLVAGVLLVGFLVSQRVLTYSIIHAERVHPEQTLFEQDLAGLSIRLGKNLLPPSVFPAQDLAVLRKSYSPYNVLPLLVEIGHPFTSAPVDASASRDLQHRWVNAVRGHPLTYLRVRWKLWTREIAWSGNSYEPYGGYHPRNIGLEGGFDANPWGYRAKFAGLDRFALAYLRASALPRFQGGVLHRVWVYLALDPLLALALLSRPTRPTARIVGWMVIAAFFYSATFLFGAMGQGFRWNWFLVLATLCAAVIVGAEVFIRPVKRRVRDLVVD